MISLKMDSPTISWELFMKRDFNILFIFNEFPYVVEIIRKTYDELIRNKHVEKLYLHVFCLDIWKVKLSFLVLLKNKYFGFCCKWFGYADKSFWSVGDRFIKTWLLLIFQISLYHVFNLAIWLLWLKLQLVFEDTDTQNSRTQQNPKTLRSQMKCSAWSCQTLNK